MATEEIFTVEEAAAYAKIAPKTLRNWLRSGRLPGMRAGRHWRVEKRVLQRFLRQQGQQAVKAPRSNGAGEAPSRVGAPEPYNRALEARIRAMHADGLTKRQIANRLNQEGVPAGTVNGRWDVDTVLAWLVTNAWVGDIRVG